MEVLEWHRRAALEVAFESFPHRGTVLADGGETVAYPLADARQAVLPAGHTAAAEHTLVAGGDMPLGDLGDRDHGVGA